MAITHRAYTFDPIQFHRQLKDQIIHDNRLDEHAMQELARITVQNATPATRDALPYLRFDEEWLNWPEEDVTYVDKWFVTILAGSLTFAPSLGHRSKVSWYILDQALPLVGWGAQEVKRLIEGDPLGSLIESSELAAWLGDIAKFLIQFGGWLSLAQAQDLEQHVFESRDELLSPSFQLESALSEFATLRHERPADLLRKAYEDVTEMLHAAVVTQNALLLILD